MGNKKALLIYPISLFEHNELLELCSNADIYMLEDPIYFTKFNPSKPVETILQSFNNILFYTYATKG